MRNCAFQYADGNGRIYENTGLITRAQANKLWQRYIQKFKDDVENGRDPEMAIWINMSNGDDYHKTAKHWCGQDFTVRDGKMFSLIPVA